MILDIFPVGPLGCNCGVLVCPQTKEAIVVDPGGDAEKILASLKKHGARPVAIVHTHAHLDHVAATEEVREGSTNPSASTAFHPGERWLIENLALQAMFLRLPYAPLKEVGHWMNDGETIRAGQLRLEVSHTPGHTPGSCSFLVTGGEGQQCIFSGDTLFRRSVGRTDLWGGDTKLLLQSIHQKLFEWPESVPVIPGHGEQTTLQEEREDNPFLAGNYP